MSKTLQLAVALILRRAVYEAAVQRAKALKASDTGYAR